MEQPVEVIGGLETLPPLPNNLKILQARLFCGDVIAISTEDGVSAGVPFVLHGGAQDWIKLTVH